MIGTEGWWQNLDQVTQWFFIAAAFFSVVFIWQLVATFMGLSGSSDVTTDVDLSADHGIGDATAAHDATATVEAFKLLSIRSILAFCTLFSWAGALYMWQGVALSWAMLYAAIWGLLGMFGTAFLFYIMRKMTERGNLDLASCVGSEGTVYLNIPEGGDGEVRINVNKVVSVVKARAANGQAIASGKAIKVKKILGPNRVEVELEN